MDLSQLRNEIDSIDSELIKLFTQRMELTNRVAQYKLDHKLDVLQSAREQEIIQTVRSAAPPELADSAEVLFTTVMDISKSVQYRKFYAANSTIAFSAFTREGAPRAACQGTVGAYSEEACHKAFPDAQIQFYGAFEDVFHAVERGEADFGVLPIQNSTAGSVAQTYELMKQYDFKIAASVKLRVSHCLAVHPDNAGKTPARVISHEQALAQCAGFLKTLGARTEYYANTALAAEYVNTHPEDAAGAICSLACARELGLSVEAADIADARENYTRFIIISKDTYSSAEADIVSVSLSLPHTKSSLYRLLTKFSVAGLNLVRIESKPIASADFDAVFYLDFEGSISDPAVAKLIAELGAQLDYFRFLGNYYEIAE
ncbi:MAG: prephenate dehydratase domain-containing protein [Oscillospiraceae bacterium]